MHKRSTALSLIGFATKFFSPHTLQTLFVMARPQPDSRVDGQSPAQPQTCRMEVLRRDAWPSGGTLQPRRCRTVATQTSTVTAPVISTQDTVSIASSPQQEGPLRDSSGIFAFNHIHFTCKLSVHVAMYVCFTVCLTDCLTSITKIQKKNKHFGY